MSSACFTSYFDLALSLLNHPSLKLAADLHLVFFNIYRMKKACSIMIPSPTQPSHSIGLLSSRINHIIQFYWPKLIRPIGLDEGLLSPIYDEEFGDEEELISFYGQFRGQVSSVIRVMVDSLLEDTIQATRDNLDLLLRKHSTLCQDNLDDRGRATQRCLFIYRENNKIHYYICNLSICTNRVGVVIILLLCHISVQVFFLYIYSHINFFFFFYLT